MITPEEVKVTDFGIVSLQNEESDITKQDLSLVLQVIFLPNKLKESLFQKSQIYIH